VVTFFEVLEAPRPLRWIPAEVKERVQPGGMIARACRIRGRLTGPDVLDYPRTIFAIGSSSPVECLNEQGFEVLSIREQPADRHPAQMINMVLRTGMSKTAAGKAPARFSAT